MTNWREIDRFCKDANGFRALAASLAVLPDLSLWETEFLTDVAGRKKVDEFTILQGEKLLEIRDSYQTTEKLRGGFSVKLLIRQVYEARLDLSDADEEWITALKSAESVRRRDAGRLMKCARQLGLIEGAQ